MTDEFFEELRRRREERVRSRRSVEVEDDPVGCIPNAAIERAYQLSEAVTNDDTGVWHERRRYESEE